VTTNQQQKKNEVQELVLMVSLLWISLYVTFNPQRVHTLPGYINARQAM